MLWPPRPRARSRAPPARPGSDRAGRRAQLGPRGGVLGGTGVVPARGREQNGADPGRCRAPAPPAPQGSSAHRNGKSRVCGGHQSPSPSLYPILVLYEAGGRQKLKRENKGAFEETLRNVRPPRWTASIPLGVCPAAHQAGSQLGGLRAAVGESLAGPASPGCPAGQCDRPRGSLSRCGRRAAWSAGLSLRRPHSQTPDWSSCECVFLLMKLFFGSDFGPGTAFSPNATAVQRGAVGPPRVSLSGWGS